MKRFLFCCSLFAFFESQAQQINPVPDYVFRNQMSVGRNAATDTAAYFSVGPRFGATKGMMPPMVVDTATFSGSKRNGLLIFSVQKNKYLYWDSVRVQWSDMAGSSGQYITGTLTSGKIPKASSSTAVTDSRMSESGLLISAPRFKADSMFFLPKMSTTPTDTGAVRYSLTDSTAYLWTGYQWIKTGISKQDTSTMLSPYLRKVDTSAMLSVYLRKVDTATMVAPYLRKVDTSAMLSSYLRKVDTATMLSPYLRKIDTLTMLSPYVRAAGYGLTKSGQSLLVDTAAMATRARVQKGIDSLGGIISASGSGTVTSVATGYGLSGGTITTTGTIIVDTAAMATRARVQKAVDSLGSIKQNTLTNPVTGTGTTSYIPKFTGTSAIGNSIAYDNGTEFLINTTSDAGAYVLQAFGAIYNTGSAAFAVSSGSVSIGTTSAQTALTVQTTGESKANFQGGAGSETGINFGDASNNAIGRLVYDNNGDYMAFYTNNAKRMTLKDDGELLLNTTGSDNGNFLLQVNGNAYVQLETILGATGDFGAYTLQVTGDAIFDGAIVTQEPGGGISNKIPWKLGNANVVSPTSPNRTITVLINGTTYYIHAKTTND